MSLRPSLPPSMTQGPSTPRDLTSMSNFASRVLRMQPDNPFAQQAAGEIERVTGAPSPSATTTKQAGLPALADLPASFAAPSTPPPPPAAMLSALGQATPATLPALPTAGTPAPNASTMNGIPPWMALLQQMPQFGSGMAGANPFGGPQGMPFGGGMPASNPLSLGGSDPRATDMRQLLLRQLMGGGMMG